MTIPKWLQDTTKSAANKQEKELAKELGMRLTPASGAIDGFKGDMYNQKYLVESKATDKASMSIKKEWLEKIEKEAIKEGKTPLLLITISGRKYVIFRLNDVEL